MCRIGRQVLVVLVVLSIVVLVQAKGAPKFTKPPKLLYRVYKDDTVKLKCAVTGTEDPMHNRTLTAWRKIGGKGNGVVRKSRVWRRFRVKNGKYLRIRNAKVEDTGTYVCVAKNQYGTTQAVIRLIVKVADFPATNSTLSDVITKGSPTTAVKKSPVFRNEETVKALKISAGKQLKLRCHARGIPTPKTKWLKNNRKINRFNRRHRRRLTKWTISFSSVTEADSGIYSCLVWNQYGNISKTFFVQVEGGPDDGRSFSPAPVQRKPVIKKHLLTNVTANVGELVTFTCTALTNLVPVFNWLKWSTINNTSNETVKITILNSSFPNVRFVREPSRWSGDKMSHCHKVKILNVTVADQGRYTCVVGSSAGYVSYDVFLRVREKSLNVQLDTSPKDSSPGPQTMVDDIEIPLAALIAIPIAFGLILIVAIIWCYIQTVRHRVKLKKNSQALAFPIANGTAPTANGFCKEKMMTINNGVVMKTLVHGNVNHNTGCTLSPKSFPKNIRPLENGNVVKLHNENDFQNASDGETRAFNCSQGNRSHDHSLNSLKVLEEVANSGVNQKETFNCLSQKHPEQEEGHKHSLNTINVDSNEINLNSMLQDGDTMFK